jgi:uncharacterized UBP type Zn finger protein
MLIDDDDDDEVISDAAARSIVNDDNDTFDAAHLAYKDHNAIQTALYMTPVPVNHDATIKHSNQTQFSASIVILS